MTCKLFRIFPIKDVEVRIAEGEKVYASGLPIGIYVKTDGILVLGTSRVTDTDGRECYPTKNLIKSGDYIVSVNGESVYEKEELMEKMMLRRGTRNYWEYAGRGISRFPSLRCKSEQGRHLFGIWVRDHLAGVGTLTYYTKDGTFGALGHAVSDGDTGVEMKLEEGWIYDADIVGIKHEQTECPASCRE